jgi:hypothetical protein
MEVVRLWLNYSIGNNLEVFFFLLLNRRFFLFFFWPNLDLVFHTLVFFSFLFPRPIKTNKIYRYIKKLYSMFLKP